MRAPQGHPRRCHETWQTAARALSNRSERGGGAAAAWVHRPSDRPRSRAARVARGSPCREDPSPRCAGGAAPCPDRPSRAPAAPRVESRGRGAAGRARHPRCPRRRSARLDRLRELAARALGRTVHMRWARRRRRRRREPAHRRPRHRARTHAQAGSCPNPARRPAAQPAGPRPRLAAAASAASPARPSVPRTGTARKGEARQEDRARRTPAETIVRFDHCRHLSAGERMDQFAP